jgi:sigma-B regulation protein RsbU (phosphoserine phosphatase)
MIGARLVNNQLLKERYQKELLETEMKRAAEIQQQLLSRDLPELDGYQVHAFLKSSRQVGGDLFELARLEDGSLLFLVADVSGKGMGAALLMSNILAAVRVLYQTRQFELLRAVELVSKQLCQYSRSTDFATLFIGQLRPGENKVHYVNAGHNAPLLVRADGNIEHLEASGVMVGAFDFASWDQQSMELGPGDLLFIFTDGVTEAENESEEMYSDERLEKLLLDKRELSADDLAETIHSDIRGFVQDAPSSDDITMLILKRTK